MKNRLMLVAAFVILLGVSMPAHASYVTYTEPMNGGFTFDSDVQDAGFLAALGAGYTHISFSGASSTDGASYSNDVTFSTMTGTFGGLNTSQVNASNEIGPFDTWDGILNIDFLANGNSVSSVGFGLVVFNTSAETIRVYDNLNQLIATFNNQLTDGFSLWGLSTTAGERIGRIELDGNFFAIQDIEFGGITQAQPVPEPASLLLLGSGLGVIGLTAWRRRK